MQDLSFELDNTGVQSEDDIRGNQFPVPGTYHLQIHDVDAETPEGGNPYLAVGLTVLAGLCDDPNAGDQRGRQFTERFFLTEKSMQRLKRFALVTGLQRPGERGSVQFANAVGRTFIGKTKEETTTNGNQVCKLEYMDFWSVNNPEVAGIPKAQVGPLGGAPNPQAPAAQPPVQPSSPGAVPAAQAPQQAPQQNDEWDI